nr:unnamed protein product [Spirometra erinaceieuropaei]
METVQFTEGMVLTELLRLRESKSPGSDEIPAKILKELACESAKPLHAVPYILRDLISATRLEVGVDYAAKGKVYNYTGFPAKNVRLIYVDKPEKVEVICYADGKRTPPKIIKYKGVKTPPSFSLVPHKPSYHVGDLITSCQISQEDEKKEVDCPFYMEVIDSITKEVIWDTSSFVTTAEIPWIMQEVPSELQVTCRGQESDVGPRLVKVNRTDILLAKPPSLSVVNDGDAAKCIGAIFKQVTNITWVYISGERQKVVGRKMYIRAGKLPETVKTPRTTTYACVGYVGKRLVSITVKYKIASLLSLKIYPQLEMYAVDQRVGCEYRSKLRESDSTDYELIHGVVACVRLVYTDGRPTEERCEKLMTTIPGAHSTLRDFFLTCSMNNLESPPIPLRVMYDLPTRLLPDQTTYAPGEHIVCDAKQYDDFFTPLYIAKVTVGSEFHMYESTLHISEVLRRFPAIWYNMTDSMPTDEFRPDLQVFIAFCETSGTFTHPRYITRGRPEDLRIEQVFPTFLAHPAQESYALPETTYKCSYSSFDAVLEWKCLNCHPSDYQTVEYDLLILRQPPFEKRIEYVCIVKEGKIAANNPQRILRIILVPNFYITSGSGRTFELTGTIVHCQAKGKSALTKSKFSIELDAVLYTYNTTESSWKVVGSGDEAYVQEDTLEQYVECIYSKRLKTGKKLFYASKRDSADRAYFDSQNVLPGMRLSSTASIGAESYITETTLLYRPYGEEDGDYLEYDRGLSVIVPEWFSYHGRVLHFQEAQLLRRVVGGSKQFTSGWSQTPCGKNENFRVSPNSKLVFAVGDYLFCEPTTDCVPLNLKLWISEPRTEKPISEEFTVAATTPSLLLRQEMAGFFKAACTYSVATTAAGAETKTIFLVTPPYDLQVQGVAEVIQAPSALVCSAKGYPVPMTQWIQLEGPSNLHVDGYGRLIVRSWDMAGSYSYLCRVSNSEGQLQTRISFNLQNAFWFRMANTNQFNWAVQVGLLTFVLSTALALPFLRLGNVRWY